MACRFIGNEYIGVTKIRIPDFCSISLQISGAAGPWSYRINGLFILQPGLRRFNKGVYKMVHAGCIGIFLVYCRDSKWRICISRERDHFVIGNKMHLFTDVKQPTHETAVNVHSKHVGTQATHLHRVHRKVCNIPGCCQHGK